MDILDRRKRRKRYLRTQYLLNVTETITPYDEYELDLVPTKHYQLEEALAQVVPQAGQAAFLLLTQNWQGTKSVDANLPRTRYVYGDAKAGGGYSGDTLVSALASIDLSPPEGAATPLAAKIATVMESAAIPAGVHADMLHYLWVQNAITGGLWPALVRAGG
jgi:ketopantoate reductase